MSDDAEKIRSFTEEDVAELAEFLCGIDNDYVCKDCTDQAHNALSYLADAGRLLAPSAEHREEWRVQRMDIESHKWEPYLMENRADAERFCEDAVWGEHARVERREIVTWAGPWVEVDRSTDA